MKYKVSEVFRSVQGEGSFTGQPSSFIRLYGCSVQCGYCDTRYSWKGVAREVGFDELRAGERLYSLVDVDRLSEWVGRVRHAVVTGGEPLEQDVGPLVAGLDAERVQIETSGTAPLGDWADTGKVWLTVSPKIQQPGKLEVLTEVIERADEIKMPVGRQRDVDRLIALLSRAKLKPRCAIWLQPLAGSSRGLRVAEEMAGAMGWRVSLQAHKGYSLR